MYVFMMGTSLDLEPRTNFALVNFMETQIIEVAAKNNFKGILMTNVDPLTQFIGHERFGYQTLLSQHIKKYENRNGKKPFSEAPMEQVIEIMYKEI